MRSNWGVSALAHGKQGPNNAAPFARLTKRGMLSLLHRPPCPASIAPIRRDISTSSLLKKSDGFEMSERKESGWGASRINRSVEGGFLNQTCVAPWAEYLFQQTASTPIP
jgi:hypothetical protein